MNPKEPHITTDALLLEQVKQSNEKAFNVLFEKHWETAYSDAFKRLKDAEAAKDVIQDIFSHIWINRTSLVIENLEAYLHVAIRNKVLKLISKKKQTHSFFDELEKLPQKNANADAPLLWKEFLIAYETLIASMPPKRQEIFRLRFQEGLDTKVISMQMGIKRKTVQNQLGKAIESVKISLLQTLSILLFLFLLAAGAFF